MAKGWKCPRCSTANDASNITCTRCGLLQGSIFVPSALDAKPTTFDTQPTARFTPPDDPRTAFLGDAWHRTSPGDDDAAVPAAPAGPAPASVPIPDTWEAADARSARVPIWRRIPVGWIVFLVIVFGGGITNALFGAGRTDTGEITKPGDLTVTDVRVGDCFDVKDPTATEVVDVVARPCVDEHQYEMFYIGSMPEGAYPPDSVFEVFMTSNCMPAFLTYVGKDYDGSKLDVYWLGPTVEGWGQGDRSIQCAVYDPQVERLTTSLKGSKR